MCSLFLGAGQKHDVLGLNRDLSAHQARDFRFARDIVSSEIFPCHIEKVATAMPDADWEVRPWGFEHNDICKSICWVWQAQASVTTEPGHCRKTSFGARLEVLE